MRRCWLLLLPALAFLHFARAQEDIGDALADFSHLEATFVQERQLAERPASLRASGRLLLSREQGIWWQQQEPFSMTLVLTESSMTQQIEGGAVQSLSTDNDNRMQQFQRLLQDLLLVDLAVLRDTFSITRLTTDQPDTWKLRLTPLSAPLNQLFTDFEIQGDTVVRSLLMRDADGGSTRLHFADHRLGQGPMSDEQRARFAR